MGICCSRVLGLFKMQHSKSLTLCWHSVDAVMMLCWRPVDALLTLCWRSVDVLLTLCWRSVDAHFVVSQYRQTRYCLSRLPILRLRLNAVAQPLNCTRCNTQNRWRSVDAHFQTGAVTMLRSLLLITAANTLILGICRSRVLGLFKMQRTKSLTRCWHSVDTVMMLCWRSVDALLTLCWRSVDALLTLCWCSFYHVAVSTHTILPIQAANTSIVVKCRRTAIVLYKMQHTKSLTLCWRSFSDWGCDHVAFSFAHKGCQYVDHGKQLANSFPIDLVTRPNIVDALLTLIFRMRLCPCQFLFYL